MGDPRPIVLVVDDDEDHVMMLEVALQAEGYDVLTATSCERAREVLTTQHVDALVADLTLGDGTSVDLLQALDQRPRVSVVLSGFDAAEDQERTRAAGFDEHLVKPTPLDRLLGVLSEGLRRRQSVMRLAKSPSRDAPGKRSAG